MVNYMPGALLRLLADPTVAVQPGEERSSTISQQRGRMTTNKANDSAPKKLYLFQLSATTVPIAPGRSLEMSLGCYLIQTSDEKNILVDTGIAPDFARPAHVPPARNETNVIEQLALLGLR